MGGSQNNRMGRVIGVLVLLTHTVAGQSPDGILRVTVMDGNGLPLSSTTVTVSDPTRGVRQTGVTDTSGEAFFGAVPPGVYDVTSAHPGFVSSSRPAVTVGVGSRQELSFVLSALDAVDSGEALELLDTLPPAPLLKADTLAASVSVLIDENQIVHLPLASRNVYSLFLLQPGVTSAGANPRRGLTFSVHGQRVSSSNYLLDGVDNNNMRVSGPVVVNSLEALQELRMVNSSFSADSGRATGFVAHAGTRRGSNAVHGALFGYLGNDALNATPSATKALELPEPAFRQVQAGYTLTGPLRRNLFGTSTFEISRLSYGVNTQIRLPTAAFIASIPASNPLRDLFSSTPPLPVTPSPTDPRHGEWIGAVTGSVNSFFSTQRLDYAFRSGRERLIARYSLARTEQKLPLDFEGYPDLWPTDTFSAHNAMGGWTKAWTAGPVNDFRVGWARERTNLDRVAGERPGLFLLSAIKLPGNTWRLMAERENNNIVQLSDILTFRRGRSAILSGFEVRRYFSNGRNGGIENAAFNATSVAGAGLYYFSSLADVAAGRSTAFSMATAAGLPETTADFARRYRSTDLSAFLQHDLKLTRHLSLNMGLRWEYFGVLHDVDPSTDYNFYLGPGATPQERLANGSLRSSDENPGGLRNRIYRPDYTNFAPSFGVAWDPFGTGRTVLRAGYAIGFDRIFDAARDVRLNRTRTTFCAGPGCAPIRIPAAEALSLMRRTPVLPSVVIVDENLRTPYAQNWFFGVQRNIGQDVLFEVGHAGSVGRKLLSRDQVNRDEISETATANDTFISNQGSSTYLGMELSIRGRTARSFRWQSSYTWSHAIDNQSDILEGPRVGPDLRDSFVATFTRALDPRIDRGSANFDQRHNFVFQGIWDLPGVGGQQHLLSGWTLSTIAGYHSGFPLAVVTANSPPGLRNNRPDLASPVDDRHEPVRGGVRWLNRNNFSVAADRVGNLGRNAISGPGSWSCDFALVKTLRFADAAFRVQLRFEAYNAFNHANAGIPVTFLEHPEFGIAYVGRSRSYYSRFGELPLDSPSRRLQFALRLHF